MSKATKLCDDHCQVQPCQPCAELDKGWDAAFGMDPVYEFEGTVDQYKTFTAKLNQPLLDRVKSIKTAIIKMLDAPDKCKWMSLGTDKCPCSLCQIDRMDNQKLLNMALLLEKNNAR